MGRAFEYRRAAKEKRWDKMSKLFPKLAKAITVATKEGGSDPDMNAKLRTAIQNAKSENMPKDNIDSAIKRAEGKDATDFAEVNYEGKGPHGVLVFVECATDNINRTVANVKHYFTKSGGSLVPTGSLEFMFTRKAVFDIEKTEEMDLEEMELELIDFGLQRIEQLEADEEDDEAKQVIRIYADYTNFGPLSQAMEDMKIEVKSSKLERFPTTSVEFDEEQMEDIEKMLDKIEDDEDVQVVFTNIE
ncbi:MAG: YebC/PmpR family DNA-binding regulatory protein [Arenicella sp.]|jgi:YebC/PmpR family DNA-binding regulatory protein